MKKLITKYPSVQLVQNVKCNYYYTQSKAIFVSTKLNSDINQFNLRNFLKLVLESIHFRSFIKPAVIDE